MYREIIQKMAEKIDWDLQQQILICERFCTYKGDHYNLKAFLLEKAENDGYTIANEEEADSLDIASGAGWSADILIDNILEFVQSNHEKDTFTRYVTNCFHAK